MAHFTQAAAPRRRWPRRLLIGLNIFVAFCLVLAGSGYAYLKWRFGQIDTVNVRDFLRGGGDDDPGEPMNVLLVGSDTRANISEDEQEHFGSEREVGQPHSDTIMILRVDPKQEKAAILSIPRDLWVEIAGTGRNQRINTAIQGGEGRLIKTIEENLGIHIDHYAQVDFNGFRGMVKALGGVTVYFESPARDKVSGLRVDQTGCVELDAEQALAFVRSRNYEYKENGRWRTDPRADLSRIERQQDFIRRVIRKAISQGARNPIKLNRLVEAGVNNVTIDDTLSTKDIFRLGKRFRSLEPSAVEMLTLPTVNARVGQAAVLKLKQPEAQQVIDRFNGVIEPGAPETLVPNIPASSVRVRVLNGSGVDGQASAASRGLQAPGFKVSGIGSADRYGYANTIIRYGTGQKVKAQLLAAYLEAGAQLQEDPTVKGVDLVLITGRDFAGVKASPGAAPAPTSSTTAPTKATPPDKAPATPEC